MELYGALMQSYLYGGIVPVALLLLVVVLLAVLRKRRAVCWFCHEPQPAGWEEGGWNCVSCRQYNGFTEVLHCPLMFILLAMGTTSYCPGLVASFPPFTAMDLGCKIMDLCCEIKLYEYFKKSCSKIQ